MIYIQLFFQLFAGGTVQLWWRLCRYAADSGTGCYNAPVAEHVGVYGSDHNFADDTGTDCGQFGNFVGIKVAGLPGAIAATAGCILPSCILVTVIAKLYLKYRNMELLQGVLGSLRPAVVAMIASAGILIMISAFWGSAPAISFEETKWSMVVIFILCVISLRKTKNKSCLGDGAGRVNESGAGIDRAMGIKTPFALPRQLMKTGQSLTGK